MKRILFLLVALCALGTEVKAIVVQKVYLKDGSVLNGYIQRQEGDGKLTIHTDYATIVSIMARLQLLENRLMEKMH